MPKFTTLSLLGLTALQGVMATPAPAVYPEVIPGPGLPSLAELGITSAQLWEMGPPEELGTTLGKLDKRYEPRCGPDPAYTHVDSLIVCYHYLRSLGTQACTVGKRTEMCRVGQAHITGSALTPTASSHCRDVAAAVLYLIDSCTRPDQSCAGSAAANGNGDLVVTASNINYW